jgi:5'-3' exonuclease
MSIFKKILALVVFLLGAFSVLNIVEPQLAVKIKDWGLDYFQDKKVPFVFQGSAGVASNVLGEQEDGDNREVSESLEEQIKKITIQILKSQLVENTTKTINKAVNEKIEENKHIPAKQIETVKKEVKKEIYEGICDDWLKQKLMEEEKNE